MPKRGSDLDGPRSPHDGNRGTDRSTSLSLTIRPWHLWTAANCLVGIPAAGWLGDAGATLLGDRVDPTAQAVIGMAMAALLGGVAGRWAVGVKRQRAARQVARELEHAVHAASARDRPLIDSCAIQVSWSWCHGLRVFRRDPAGLTPGAAGTRGGEVVHATDSPRGQGARRGPRSARCRSVPQQARMPPPRDSGLDGGSRQRAQYVRTAGDPRVEIGGPADVSVQRADMSARLARTR